jgi:hypothetical protein
VILETANGSYRTVNVLVRWHVDRMFSWVRERLPGMQSRLDPDANVGDTEIYGRLDRLERLIVTRPPSNSYHEGGDKRLQQWILAILSGLSVAAILGGVAIYGEVKTIARGQSDHDRRIESLERINERRYRGADGTP